MTNEHAPDATAEMLTVEEAAAVFRTPVATLRDWRQLGVGPDGFRLGRRVVHRRKDVYRWVAERQQPSHPADSSAPEAKALDRGRAEAGSERRESFRSRMRWPRAPEP